MVMKFYPDAWVWYPGYRYVFCDRTLDTMDPIFLWCTERYGAGLRFPRRGPKLNDLTHRWGFDQTHVIAIRDLADATEFRLRWC